MHLVVLTQVLDRRDAVLGFFHTWCEHFARHVDELTVIAQQVGDIDLPAHVHVVSLGRDQGAGRAAMIARLVSGLARLRGAHRPDAVWAHMVPRFALGAATVTKPRRIPLYLWYTHKGVDTSLRLSAPLVRAVFTASHESFRLEGAADKRVVTGHGIDGTHFRPPQGPRTIDVLTVGRIAPSKGQLELLEALSRMDAVPTTEIAGDILLDQDAAYRDEVGRRAENLGAVTLLGAVPYTEIAAVMARARVMVNASRTGSVDKVVLEAMACGTIPLTCNESFVPLLGEELSARLMFRRDDPEDLAARLTGLLTLPEDERQALGTRLRALVMADHDVARLVPRMVAIMQGRVGLREAVTRGAATACIAAGVEVPAGAGS